jgi:prepilin-type N-terminal cleavage/methylation domain-containing protein
MSEIPHCPDGMTVRRPLPGGGCINRRRGFSLLELVIVIAIMSILITAAISRLLVLQVDAERVAMETVAGTLRSALGIKVAQQYARQNMDGIRALRGSNPMDQLAQLPGNYLGALDEPDPGSLPDGNWYFDTRCRCLIYVVRNQGYFSGGLANPARARFAVGLVYSQSQDNGARNIEGIRLEPLEKYRWTAGK